MRTICILKLTCAAILAIGVNLTVLVPGAPAGTPEAVLQPGMWEGSAECGRGKTYLALSVDLHPFNRRSNRAAGRLDFSATPGAQPFARVPANIMANGGRLRLSLSNIWSYRPMDLEPLTGGYATTELTLSDDARELRSEGIGSCRDIRLTRLPRAVASGGIETAFALPPVLEGSVGCFGGRTHQHIRLEIDPAGPSSFDGRVLLRSAASPTDDPAVFSVIGDFEAGTATVTVIGDRWIEQPPGWRETLDFTGTIQQNGQRIVGDSQSGRCGVVDLHVPGTDAMQQIRPSDSPAEPESWDTPAGCAALIAWALQAEEETGGQSLYRGMSSAKAEEIAIGLFADERFVPHFGIAFEEMSSEQRQRVLDVAEACRHQLFSAVEIYESAAHLAVAAYFPERNSAEWIRLKRFNILQKRLQQEMAELERTAVGEPDLPRLEAVLTQLPERFSELWSADLAAARSLIGAKIDAAKGAMVDRLESEIDALPASYAAFEQSRPIRRDIAVLGSDRQGDQDALNTQLDRALGHAAQAVLKDLDERLASLEPSLNTLEQARQNIEFVWSTIGPFVDPGGPGFSGLSATLQSLADATFPAFAARTEGMIDPEAPFPSRASQFGAAIDYLARTVPSSPLFARIFQTFAAHVEGLKPVPTLDDVVEDDGSPTAFGLRSAVADFVKDTWASTFAVFPFDISFVTNQLRVSDVVKEGCEPASAGGYWCDFRLSVSSALPFSSMMRNLPSRARVTRRDLAWRVVETPPQQARSSAAYDEVNRSQQQWQQQWNDITMEGLMMD